MGLNFHVVFLIHYNLLYENNTLNNIMYIFLYFWWGGGDDTEMVSLFVLTVFFFSCRSYSLPMLQMDFTQTLNKCTTLSPLYLMNSIHNTPPLDPPGTHITC